MPRGGRRNGAPGQAYGNRSDLNAGAKPVPLSAAPGQQYGAAKTQMDAQRALPMQGTPMPPTAPSTPGPGQPPVAGPPPNPVYPGDHGDFLRPTQRPAEPVTAGLPVGAGAGPVQPNDPVISGLAMLNALGANLPPEIAHLKAQLDATSMNQAAP